MVLLIEGKNKIKNGYLVKYLFGIPLDLMKINIV